MAPQDGERAAFPRKVNLPLNIPRSNQASPRSVPSVQSEHSLYMNGNQPRRPDSISYPESQDQASHSFSHAFTNMIDYTHPIASPLFIAQDDSPEIDAEDFPDFTLNDEALNDEDSVQNFSWDARNEYIELAAQHSKTSFPYFSVPLEIVQSPVDLRRHASALSSSFGEVSAHSIDNDQPLPDVHEEFEDLGLDDAALQAMHQGQYDVANETTPDRDMIFNIDDIDEEMRREHSWSESHQRYRAECHPSPGQMYQRAPEASSTYLSPSRQPSTGVRRRNSSTSKNKPRTASLSSLKSLALTRGGRNGPLNPMKRDKVGRIRRYGACRTCSIKKCECDELPLCRKCIARFGSKVLQGPCLVSTTKEGIQELESPCRRPVVDTLIAKILCEGNRWHPSPQSEPYFFNAEYRRVGYKYTIPLDLGFGPDVPPWCMEVEQVVCDSMIYRHDHFVQVWPSSSQDSAPRGPVSHVLLPAVFADTTTLEDALYGEYGRLVDGYWAYFPKYESPLRILDLVYSLYKHHALQNPEEHSQRYAKLLREALILLVAVHVAGDLVVRVDDANVQTIMRFVPNGEGNPAVTCCLLRAQLGAVLPKLVKTLLRSVIHGTLMLSLDKDCKHFPVAFAAFYVLFVTIDSLIYHGAKVPFHYIYDQRSHLHSASPHPGWAVPEDIEIGANILFDLYFICFPACHAVHLMRNPEAGPTGSKTHRVQRSEGTMQFLKSLYFARDEAQKYLNQRSSSKFHEVREADEVHWLLDRHAARFVLLRVRAASDEHNGGVNS